MGIPGKLAYFAMDQKPTAMKTLIDCSNHAAAVVPLFVLVLACTACAKGKDAVPGQAESVFSLRDVAEIMSELPMEESHLAEVFDAVSASSQNGYDEEYMLSDLVGNPGAGVGDTRPQGKASRYSRPLRDLLAEYFRSTAPASTRSAPDAEACMRILEASDIQIYWPYSEDWDGEAFPIITFDPGDGSEYNYGYQLGPGADGKLEKEPVYVDEQVAMSRPVWVINNNGDSHLDPVRTVFLDGIPEADVSALEEGLPGNMLYIRSLKMLRNYDSWFGGASEFMIKCGAVDGFRATSEEDLAKYRPSVTDCVVVVKRRQLGMNIPLGVLLLTDYTPQMEKIAFLVTEDDGGEIENWKCEATVKWQSKSYGFTLNIPYRDRDDIVWRGQLSRSFFERGGRFTTDRFGDVEITFELR